MIRQTEINYWTNRQREMETAARDALKLYRPTGVDHNLGKPVC